MPGPDDWLLTPQRVAVHRPSGSAVVADLHLGYGQARRRGGGERAGSAALASASLLGDRRRTGAGFRRGGALARAGALARVPATTVTSRKRKRRNACPSLTLPARQGRRLMLHETIHDRE